MPAKNGSLVRREEHSHRPAALTTVQRHRRLHVDLVEIRPLFAIDLDTDEMSFIRAAIASFSNDSRSITWHQWQAE